MRRTLLLLVVAAGCGAAPGADERCLEIQIAGLQPGQDTWVVEAEYVGTSQTPLSVGALRGFLVQGWHGTSCTSPQADETWRVVVWYDDSGTYPLDTYCKDPWTDCTPRSGQPSGEKTFAFPGRGYTTVQVTVHPP